MARKSSGSLFGMLLYAVGGYLLYENWPAVSAWFTSVDLPAAAVPAPAAVPASAGTVVSTAPVATTSPIPAASGLPLVPPSPGTVVSTAAPAPATVAPATPAPTSMIMRPISTARIPPTRFTVAAAPNTVQIQQQIQELQDEVRQATNANGYTNQDRQDLHRQILALQAQL